MPRRGNAPGLKRGRHNLPYWIARQVVRDPKGFPDPCIALPSDASDERLADLCREHTARLQAWIDSAGAEGAVTITKYDGRIAAAVRIYQEHPRSRFHKIKYNSRKTYITSLKLLEATVGRKLVSRTTTLDVEHWYDEWRKPEKFADEEGTITFGPERIDRAHDAVSMLRTVLWFMTALRHKDCKQLAEELKAVKFEKGGAREEEMTYAQTSAFIKKALELGHKGVMPAKRALHMAIGTAAQFELILRQRDIIGEYLPNEAEARRAGPRVEPQRFEGDWWVGQFTWERIPGWRWRMKTSKSKYRSAAEFDLTTYDLLYPLLELVPLSERKGAIVKGERDLPVRQSSYGKWFRQIARAAGIPDNVWNMDTRAGGITEAEEAGAVRKDVQGAATHADEKTTLRYIRMRKKSIARVNEARKQDREAGSDGTG